MAKVRGFKNGRKVVNRSNPNLIGRLSSYDGENFSVHWTILNENNSEICHCKTLSVPAEELSEYWKLYYKKKGV